jgi:CDP-paratose 2-epimerase
MKLLITGGCGFLGSNLSAHAIKIGIDLCVFDNLYRNGSVENYNWLKGKGNFKFVHGDIRSQNDIKKVISTFQPDVIFHLAGQVAMTTSISNPQMDFEVNAIGTFNLIEAVRKYVPGCGIIYSSTNKVYGDLEQFNYEETEKRYICKDMPDGFNEEIPLSFHSPYGCSKGTADQYLIDYNRIFNLKTVVFRHSSMYGGRQFATEDQGWVGWFCKMADETKKGNRHQPFTISGNGKQVRDVLHCEDMISLYFSSASKIDQIAGQAFNIGGGMQNSLSLLELFEILENEISNKLKYVTLKPRESDQRVFVSDLTKIKKYVNWEPKMNKIDGVVNMLHWIQNSK